MVDPDASGVLPVPVGTATPSPASDGPTRSLPANQQVALLRGPLVLSAISRVLLIPFYLFCAVGASGDLWKLWPSLRRYPARYVADKALLAASMWAFLLLSVLLAGLFFTRRRAFRPLMVYFCGLFLLLLAGFAVHVHHFPQPRQPHPTNPLIAWFAGGVVAFMCSGLLWPFYYVFSPRVKRVFMR